MMNELIEKAIQAQGGLNKWNKIKEVTATFRASGVAFKARGPVGESFMELPKLLTVSTREQRVSLKHFITKDTIGYYEPNRTYVTSLDGTLLENLDNPRENLKIKTPGTPWTATEIMYFIGYSMWMYVTLPYSFLMDGVKYKEIDPFIEDGETWRGLKVTYPHSFPVHSTDQIHYFDKDGFMRRQDYTVDVRQDLGAAHYIYDYQEVEGFKFPSKRRIFSRDLDNSPQLDKLLISADFSDFKVG